MIISVEEAKREISDFKDWTDSKIERKLKAVEETIRSYTHNNFQKRSIRVHCSVVAQKIHGKVTGLNVGDTIMISQSLLNDGLYVVESIDENLIALDRRLIDESDVLVTMVEYPADVVECAFDMLNWDLKHGDKVGIQSETLSRHSVTYFNLDADNSSMGYPKSVLGALKPYMKARF